MRRKERTIVRERKTINPPRLQATQALWDGHGSLDEFREGLRDAHVEFYDMHRAAQLMIRRGYLGDKQEGLQLYTVSVFAQRAVECCEGLLAGLDEMAAQVTALNDHVARERAELTLSFGRVKRERGAIVRGKDLLAPITMKDPLGRYAPYGAFKEI